MQELIIGILGAGGAILVLRLFDKYNVNKNQKKLEEKVIQLKRDQSRIELDQSIEDSKTKGKVDEIEQEKSKKLDIDGLIDFFRNR